MAEVGVNVVKRMELYGVGKWSQGMFHALQEMGKLDLEKDVRVYDKNMIAKG